MKTAKGGRWAPVAQAWIDHPEVGADELAVLTVLSLHADSEGVCWPSQGLIADKLKRSRAWVIKIINRLEELGLVVRTRRHHASGGLRSCLYHLVGRPCALGAEHRSRGDSGCHGHDREQTESETQVSLSLSLIGSLIGCERGQGGCGGREPGVVADRRRRRLGRDPPSRHRSAAPHRAVHCRLRGQGLPLPRSQRRLAQLAPRCKGKQPPCSVQLFRHNPLRTSSPPRRR
jgi:hypothetical protein